MLLLGLNSLKNRIIAFLLLLLFSPFLLAQQSEKTSDSITFKPLEITEKKLPPITQKTVPVQTFNRLNLERLAPLQISDAIKHFAGVSVKDYGGIGGLKTVSVRSLGAAHTGISYDGIPLGDCQSGQIDLGRFSAEGLEMISLANGQSPDMLQTARALASASLLTLATSVPYFDSTQWVKGSLGVKAGSFGLFNPSLLLQNKITSKLSTSFIFGWQKAKGDYPYIVDYGDSTSNEKRDNSDISSLNAEANLYYSPKENQQLTAKAYIFDSERGLPGAITFYNLYNSKQRLWDKNYFAQTGYKINLPKEISLLFNGKYNYAYTRYLDPNYPNSQGKLDNEYKQNETYASAAISQGLANNLRYLFTSDGFINTLTANQQDFTNPTRYTWLAALAAQYNGNLLAPFAEPLADKPLLLSMKANLLSTFSEDRVEIGVQPENKKHLSPNINIALQPFGKNSFQIRFFYKDIYRMPTFNDMYYRQVGNSKLRPEIAKQLNVGVSYYDSWKRGAHYISASADIYNNKITDKIVAIPAKNLFEWSMMNVGKVLINGLDIALRGGFSPVDALQIFLESSYTYQKALDMTDPESKSYKNYIPYTPVHSGSGAVGFTVKNFTLSYSLVFTGERYTLGENIPRNLLESYTDQNILIAQKFKIKKTELRLSAEILNLLDTQYEVIKSFPMPGRSYRVSAGISF